MSTVNEHSSADFNAKACESAYKKLTQKSITNNVSESNLSTRDTLPDYIVKISRALESEEEAIREYEAILQLENIPNDVRIVIEEIENDEKDHLVNLSRVIENEVTSKFPNNGETDLVTESTHNEDIEQELEEDVSFSRISYDGINNTIKYEISANVDYDDDAALRAYSAALSGVSQFNIEMNPFSLVLDSFRAGKLVLTFTSPADYKEMTDELAYSIVTYITDKSEYLRLM